MKDEKMAEESLISYRKEPKWAGKIFMQDENTCYKEGFLAGLKAGRPQWHYPSKGEYPKVEGEYLVIFESDRTKYKGLESYYPDTKEWSTICKIIAWCEIPTFDKE